jgi:ubiquinone/menaquinone biosynthesis C-methylase UbiE
METEFHKEKLHSQDYFNEQRNFWRNQDFLELMAKRWQFKNIHSVLDVGCGIGHWGQLLVKLLPIDCHVVGIDREAEWVSEAGKRALTMGLAERCRYLQGQAETIPFASASFDLVTCQTVLMHLKNPRQAIREFMRVLKPGGRIIVAEPNNMTSNLLLSSISDEESIDDIVDRFRFYLICERGKQSLGEGHSSIGCLVPGLFAECGLKAIEVYQSDKCTTLVAPYESVEQRVHAMQALEYVDKGLAPWDRNESRRYFQAGGGRDDDFEKTWLKLLNYGQAVAAAIRGGYYHSAGGGVFYLISGQKI